ncbi:MAG: class I SAM-dependent methyltransferase [Candidatus Micrarchaeia archaeon]
MSDSAIGDQEGPRRIALPYDTENGQVKLLTSIDEIIEFDRALREITEGLSRPVRIGSIFRLPEVAYANWGVGITEANKEGLRSISNTFYQMDAEESRIARFERDDLHWLKKDLTAATQETMATYISRFVREIITAVDDGGRCFRIANIACGSGRLSDAIAATLVEDPDSEDIIRRTEFHLIDFSEKIAMAENNLRGYGALVVPHPMNDEMFLESPEDGFDFIVSLSHLHRKPFLGEYLAKAHQKLSAGGLFISGDYHSILCQHPIKVYELLDKLGIENSRLNRFDELMGPLMRVQPQGATHPDKAAMEDHANYWNRLSWELGNLRYNGAMKVRILGAFLSTDQVTKRLNEAGFETDSDKIRSAFNKARLPLKFPVMTRDGVDTTALSVGLKRR